jgi:hypothetical protein
LIRQDDVKQDWNVLLNEKSLGKLLTMEAALMHTLVIPAGQVVQGTNTLSFVAPKIADDILLGEITLFEEGPWDLMGKTYLNLSVKEAGSGNALPARITIVDKKGALAALYPASGDRLVAQRPGVIYAGPQGAMVGLIPGLCYTWC